MAKESTVVTFCLVLLTALAPPALAEDCPYQKELIAGQHTDAGDVLVWRDGCTLFVKYVTCDCWEITETHLHVAADWGDIPQTKKGNPIPGQFEYKGTHDSVTEYTYEIPLDAPCDGSICIAAHAVVKCGDREETAWGEGEDFPGNNWAMYFCLTPPECEPSCDDPVLLNGNFEKPVVETNQGWNIFENGAPNLGWTIEWTEAFPEYNGQTPPTNGWLELMTDAGTDADDEIPDTWQAQDGDQWAELDSDWDGPNKTLGLDNEPASVQISQAINTCPDRTYKLTFYYSPRPGYAKNSLTVVWGAQQLFSISDLAGGASTNWTKKEYTGLVPTGTSTTLYFAEAGPPDADALGMFLDAVSVELEPLP